MTLDEMVADLQKRIGSSPEIDAVQLESWINQGMQQFCMESDFSWLEKKQTASTVNGQAEYALPSDHKRIVELRVDPTTSDPNIYRFVPHEQRANQQSSEDYFSVFGDNFTINPTPTAAGTNNIHLWYIRRPTKMSDGGDSPSDTDIANMPEDYHEALILYAYAIYNAYDEEHDEKREIMGNPRSPVPGTFYYFVDLAKREDHSKKRGARRKMLSKQEFIGWTKPNRVQKSSVLRI